MGVCISNLHLFCMKYPADKKDIDFFSMKGHKSWGRMINNHDGDTLTVIMINPYNQKLIKHRIRLFGVDTPELTSKDPKEKEKAILAKGSLHNLLFNRMLYIEASNKNDKYGRLLANVFVWHDTNKINVSDWLIENQYGKPYLI